MSIDYCRKKERLQIKSSHSWLYRKLNEIENKEVNKVYILILNCDGPLLLQDPSSFQLTQSSTPSNNYKLSTPLSSYKQQLQQ